MLSSPAAVVLFLVLISLQCWNKSHLSFLELRKAVKKLIRREKKELRKRTAKKIREQSGTSCKLFWSDLKGRKKKRKIYRMKDMDGGMVENEAMLEVMAKYWEELGKGIQCSLPDNGGVRVTEFNENLCEELQWDEVVNTLKCVKRGKSLGPDGILNEMLMYGGGRMVESLISLFNVVIQEECCPEDWLRYFVVPLFKDGDPDQVTTNYRGIALGSCVAKVFTRILSRRLGEFAEEYILTEAQGEFRSRRMCSDQIFILRGACKLRRKKVYSFPRCEQSV